jgi:lipopolysaccharide transport system permease protein
MSFGCSGSFFFALAIRDVRVRYKQTVIGILWAILQPFLLMVVFSVFFGQMIGIDTEGVPYPIFVFSGLLFWNYFSSSLSAASSSMVANQAIVQKIYFPRIILPISSTIVFLLDFFLASVIFAGMMMFYGFTPTLLGLALVVPCLIITALTFTGLGLFFSAMNVKYRDVRYVLPFCIQILLFVTPVIYPPSLLGSYQWLWYLNPMSGVIDVIRDSFFLSGSVDWQLFGIAGIVSVLFFAAGVLYFNMTEKYFADLI